MKLLRIFMTPPRINLFLPAINQRSEIKGAATILGAPKPFPDLIREAADLLIKEGFQITPGARITEIVISSGELARAIYGSQSNTSDTTADEAARRVRNRIFWASVSRRR